MSLGKSLANEVRRVDPEVVAAQIGHRLRGANGARGTADCERSQS
jgi:hypothetical protein